MGVERLDGVREKLLRAAELLQDIREAEAEYIVTEDFGIRRQFETAIPEKSGRSGLTWRAVLQPPPPLRIAVLCGEFIHDLRSALDHVAWALVLENGGAPNRSTYFPVLADRLDEDRNIQPLRIPGGISSAAEFLLEALQPYRQTDDPSVHPLAVLTELWNIDKHRTLNVVGVNLGRVTIHFPADGRTGYTVAQPFEDGALIYWVLTENPAYNPDPKETIEYSPSLALRDVQGATGNQPVPLIDLLEGLAHYIRYEVVDQFASLCFGQEVD